MLDPALVQALAARRVRCCLIGGAALAVHGWSRAPADVDLLTLDDRVLHAHFWLSLPPTKVHWGRTGDPLRGMVRWSGPIDVDLVVGLGYAFEHALASPTLFPPLPVPVATPLALVLLKLEAGGLSDLADIAGLVQVRRALDGAPWLSQLPQHLPKLSPEARAAWAKVGPQLGI